MWCDNGEIFDQTMETVKRFKWFNSIWSNTGEKRLTNCFSRRTTDIRYSSKHHKQVEKDRNYSQRERERKIQWRLNGRIVCFKQNLNVELCVIFISVIRCRQHANNLVSIRQSENCKKITIPNIRRNSHSTGKQVIESKKLIVRRCHLILHLSKMFGTFSKIKFKKNKILQIVNLWFPQ